jgi:hypothetical protein
LDFRLSAAAASNEASRLAARFLVTVKGAAAVRSHSGKINGAFVAEAARAPMSFVPSTDVKRLGFSRGTSERSERLIRRA